MGLDGRWKWGDGRWKRREMTEDRRQKRDERKITSMKMGVKNGL